MTVEPNAPNLKDARAAVMERMARELDRYLPESGELRKWTISEIEDALIEDVNEIQTAGRVRAAGESTGADSHKTRAA